MIEHAVTMTAQPLLRSDLPSLPPETYFTAVFLSLWNLLTAAILHFVWVTICLTFVHHLTVGFLMAGTSLECAPSVWHKA